MTPVERQWVRTQFICQLAFSKFLTASSYTSSEGSSTGHQETPFTRNICRVLRLNQYSRSKPGDAGSRTLDIVGGRAAHSEEDQPAKFENLSTHKMDHMRADIVNLPAVLGVNRQSVQLIKVFVVSVYKKGCERSALQPVEPVYLPG